LSLAVKDRSLLFNKALLSVCLLPLNPKDKQLASKYKYLTLRILVRDLSDGQPGVSTTSNPAAVQHSITTSAARALAARARRGNQIQKAAQIVGEGRAPAEAGWNAWFMSRSSSFKDPRLELVSCTVLIETGFHLLS
jgi:hypothetical protein